ncbi:MAG: PAS domain S-box protein, partial [Calditrichaeota bacterium]
MEQAPNPRSGFRLPGGLIGVIIFLTALPLVMALLGVGTGWGYPREIFTPGTKNFLAIEPIEPLIFHAVLDWIALLGVATMAFLAMLRFRLSREVFAPLIGLCFSAGGLLLLQHILISHNLWPRVPFSASALFSTWLGSRLFFPLTMTLGLFMLERAQPLRKSHYPSFLKQTGLLLGGLSVIGLLTFWLLAGVDRLVNFALPLNFLVAMFYLSAALFVNSVGRKLYPGYFSEALLLSFVPLTAAQFLLLFASGPVLSNLELFAHFLMAFGFFIPFGGLTIDYIHTYHRKAQSARELRQVQNQLMERSRQLEETNRILQQQIEERRKTQAQLRESEERARMIIETATDAFIGIDQNGRITEWNHQAEVTFGWSKEEILGSSIYEKILMPPFSKAFAEEIQNYLETHDCQFIFNQIELTARHR